MSAKPQKPKITIQTQKSPDFRVIPVSSIHCEIGPFEGTLVVSTDYPSPIPGPKGVKAVVREVQAVLKIPPALWKHMAKTMTEFMNQLEKKLGAPVPEQKPGDPTSSYIG